MPVTGTQIAYWMICHRKLWLFANQIQMEYTSETVAEGKFIGETSYDERAEQYRELSVGPVKIDHYDAANRVIHEVKKSNKVERAHLAQVKYYILVLEDYGIEGVTAILEYPKLRQTHRVELTDNDRKELKKMIKDITTLIHQEECPPLTKKSICTSCSYYEFCYSGEKE